MSLKTIPGSGKSGTSATSRSSAARASSVTRYFCRLDFDCRDGCWRPLDRLSCTGRRVAGTVRPRPGAPGLGCRLGADPETGASSSSTSSASSIVVARRHVLGEHRNRRVRVGLGPGSRLRATLGLLDLGLVRLQVRHQRGGDEDRRVDTGGGTHEQGERQVLERARAELYRADVEDHADRDQRHDRGVDRPHQCLVDRQVGGLRVALLATAGGSWCCCAPGRRPRRCRRARSRGSSAHRSRSPGSPRTRRCA